MGHKAHGQCAAPSHRIWDVQYISTLEKKTLVISDHGYHSILAKMQKYNNIHTGYLNIVTPELTIWQQAFYTVFLNYFFHAGCLNWHLPQCEM